MRKHFFIQLFAILTSFLILIQPLTLRYWARPILAISVLLTVWIYLLLDYHKKISEQKVILKNLADENRELDDIVSKADIGLAIIDSFGLVEQVNKQFKMIAKEAHFVDNRNGSINIRYSTEFVRIITLANKKSHKIKDEIKLGSRWYLCIARSLYDAQKIIVVLTDITKSKQVDKIKRNLIANVSHELNTPLTIINGYADLLLEKEFGKESSEYLETMKKHINRLMVILKDVLELSKLEKDDKIRGLCKLNAKNSIDGVIDLLKPKIEENSVKVKIVCPSDIEIVVNPQMFEQMMFNLIENGIKFSKNGQIEISYKEKKNRVVEIIVSDTGIGIARRHIDKIFERFFVVSRSRSGHLVGTGLGLAIVKHIVVLHNGAINVKSKVGEGTKFIIWLPRG